MRITGGESKGRTLNFPSRSTSRPTSDFLRETLFNLLGDISGQNFLDLFAGSGSVGLEALSRKARKVVFVEKNKSLSGIILRNVSSCGYADKSVVISTDFQIALRGFFEKQCRFDVIFSDPPYHQGLIEETLKQLVKFPLLLKDGIIVLQHSDKEKPSELPDGIFITDQRKYGENFLTFARIEINGR